MPLEVLQERIGPNPPEGSFTFDKERQIYSHRLLLEYDDNLFFRWDYVNHIWRVFRIGMELGMTDLNGLLAERLVPRVYNQMTWNPELRGPLNIDQVLSYLKEHDPSLRSGTIKENFIEQIQKENQEREKAKAEKKRKEDEALQAEVEKDVIEMTRPQIDHRLTTSVEGKIIKVNPNGN
jgi:hypothetical protein